MHQYAGGIALIVVTIAGVGGICYLLTGLIDRGARHDEDQDHGKQGAD